MYTSFLLRYEAVLYNNYITVNLFCKEIIKHLFFILVFYILLCYYKGEKLFRKVLDMIKVTCLGDSIRQQYAPRVKELLGNGFEMFYPEENCRFVKYTLRGLFEWSEGMKGSRIVHWNNGLWDVSDLFGDGALFSTDDEYVSNILRVADILLKKYEVVIFATTTPVTVRNQYNKNSDIMRLNELVVPKLRERGVIINDLYSLVASDIDRYVSDDDIHLSEEGIELCAKQVARVIRSAAEGLSDREPSTVIDTQEQIRSGAPVLID